jgi:hypothetical protein
VTLPCFEALAWPDYDTKVLEVTLGGKPAVIQLWKGWCQKFLGLDDFPGGIGAEVGIYRRLATPPKLALPPELPHVLAHLVETGAKLATDELWWPYPELNTKLTFELVNPVTSEVVFTAGPETTYWLCKWMDRDSFATYKEQQDGQAPLWAADYTLRFTVDGAAYTW